MVAVATFSSSRCHLNGMWSHSQCGCFNARASYFFTFCSDGQVVDTRLDYQLIQYYVLCFVLIIISIRSIEPCHWNYTLFAFLNETFESFRTPGLVPPEIFKSSLKNIAVPSSSTSQFLTTFLLNIICKGS